MSKKFDIVTIILMIALIVLLFFVVFNYFTHSNSLDTVTNSNLHMIDAVEGLQNVSGSNTVLKNNVFELSGDSSNQTSIIDENVNSGDVSNLSGDGVIDTVYIDKTVEKDNESMNEPAQNDVTPKDSTALIITSNDNISDKEKKEVLKELDETLMDLLDVIDSVQIIDESRLETSESEVQQ
ncbi:MAG: hypothetical protein IJX99_03685 [Clostridia bacterium]|nr:hypothetical protein [Clostridia bacterium]